MERRRKERRGGTNEGQETEQKGVGTSKEEDSQTYAYTSKSNDAVEVGGHVKTETRGTIEKTTEGEEEKVTANGNIEAALGTDMEEQDREEDRRRWQDPDRERERRGEPAPEDLEGEHRKMDVSEDLVPADELVALGEDRWTVESGDPEPAVDRMRQALRALRERRVDLEVAHADLEAARSEVATLKEQVRMARGEADAERAAKQTLEEDAAALQSQFYVVRAELDDSRTSGASLAAEVEAMGSQISTAQGDLKAARAQLKDAQTQLEEVRKSKAALGADAEALYSLLGAARVQRDEARREKALAIDEAKNLQAQLAKVRAELDAVQDSRTGDLTAVPSNLRSMPVEENDTRTGKASLVGTTEVLESELSSARAESVDANALRSEATGGELPGTHRAQSLVASELSAGEAPLSSQPQVRGGTTCDSSSEPPSWGSRPKKRARVDGLRDDGRKGEERGIAQGERRGKEAIGRIEANVDWSLSEERLEHKGRLSLVERQDRLDRRGRIDNRDRRHRDRSR